MTFKKILSAAAAFTIAAAAAISIMISTVSAAEKELTYIGPSANAYALENDGVSLRLNIYNQWSKGQETADILDKGEFAEKISVNFTVSGLGSDSANVAEDGTETPFYAFLSGSVGVDSYWEPTADNPKVAIEGDGTYTADFMLSTPADTVLCLILSTNINAYQYTSSGKPADTGIEFKVNKITTGTVGEDTTDATDATDTTGATEATDETDAEEETTEPATGGVEPTPTEEPEATEAPTTEATVTTTVQTTAAAQTAANNTSGGSTSGNQVSGSTSNAPGTKDAGIALAFAGLAVTAMIGVLTQIKKK